MCTSFISRKDNIVIGMNFDNNGMKYSISKKNNDWFVVFVDGGRGKYPSFGVDAHGRFFNNLLVESNGKGLYQRPSSKVTHTTKLIADILNGVITPEKLGEYLEGIEVVNTPDWSCHNMICDSNANVWIVEPGRGNLYSPRNESPFLVMANESLIDLKSCNAKSKCNRCTSAGKKLSSRSKIDVDFAFEILKSVSQHDGDWKTDFSMVFSKKDSKVYFCYNRDFTKIFEHTFA
jgi:hypothetical protein